MGVVDGASYLPRRGRRGYGRWRDWETALRPGLAYCKPETCAGRGGWWRLACGNGCGVWGFGAGGDSVVEARDVAGLEHFGDARSGVGWECGGQLAWGCLGATAISDQRVRKFSRKWFCGCPGPGLGAPSLKSQGSFVQYLEP